MRRSRKIILIALLGIVVLAGSIGGIALAADNDEGDTTPKFQRGALLEKVCEIYNENNDPDIDCAALEDAFAQAQSERMTEARENCRQRLIDEGEMTEEQLEEWQAWMESRPDFPTDEFKEWMESRPDLPFEHGLRGFGGRFGGGFPKWGGPCAPPPADS